MTGTSPLMKNPYTPLAKSFLVSLGLTAPVSAIDATIQNKFLVQEQH